MAIIYKRMVLYSQAVVIHVKLSLQTVNTHLKKVSVALVNYNRLPTVSKYWLASKKHESPH